MNNIQKHYAHEKIALERKLNSITNKKSLVFFDIFIELSEVKNIIRKNCLHQWETSDLEMGKSNETQCKVCGMINYYHLDF